MDHHRKQFITRDKDNHTEKFSKDVDVDDIFHYVHQPYDQRESYGIDTDNTDIVNIIDCTENNRGD